MINIKYLIYKLLGLWGLLSLLTVLVVGFQHSANLSAWVGGRLQQLQLLQQAQAKEIPNTAAEQKRLVKWLSRKYRVGEEPMTTLVASSFQIAQQEGISPTLILAVIAAQSGFNPFSEGYLGSQGLMQVLAEPHSEKYDELGGRNARFYPMTNLSVGAQVLHECIAQAGNTEAGLLQYFGVPDHAEMVIFVTKVLAEEQRLSKVLQGIAVPVFEDARI